jgi:hypothetical protein
VVATLTSAPGAVADPLLGATMLVAQLVLGGAFVMSGRIGPVVIAAAGIALLDWARRFG